MTILEQLAKLTLLIVIVGVLAAGLLLPYVGGGGLLAKAGADKFLNTDCTLAEPALQQRTTLYASDGKTVIATLFDQNRQVVPFTQMPKNVINALVATEDRRFYEHHGVDLRGLIRGALKTSGGSTQGASTLTEQYVKQANYYKAITEGDHAAAEAAIVQNLDRKISDAKCALKIEKTNSKDQILAKYLNIAFFGENSYGIQIAAQTFFGVNANKLTVSQAALLVGLVKSPTSLDPFVAEQVSDARDRRDLVISNMAGQNYITQAQASAAKLQPIKLAPQRPPARGCAFSLPTIKNVGFFCDYAYSWLQSVGGLSKARLDTGGFKIITTIDARLQNQVQASVWKDMPISYYGNPANYRSATTKAGPSAAIMPGVDPKTGNIKFFATSREYGSNGQNRTTNPLFTTSAAGSGSTFKYFNALAALKLGVQDTFRLTTSDPYTVRNCPPTNDGKPPYSVHNAGSYNSSQSLRSALVASSNTFFVGMEDQVFDCNVSTIVQTTKDLGVSSLSRTDANGKTLADRIITDHRPSFTLGQEVVSPLDLASAYGAAANDGVLCPPTPVLSITGSTGRPVAFKRLPCVRKFDPYSARTIINMMIGDTKESNGTAVGKFGSWYGAGGSAVAGKTGTNNGSNPVTHEDSGKNAALWFVGVTPSLVSTTAIYNPDAPTHDIYDAPGFIGDASESFGAIGAGLWVNALKPSLGTERWSWQDAQDIPGGITIPTVKGQTPASATAELTAKGFKVAVLPTQLCGSSYPAGMVALAGPGFAAPGSVITMCLSSGKPTSSFVFVPFRGPTKTQPAPAPTKPVTPPRRRGGVRR